MCGGGGGGGGIGMIINSIIIKKNKEKINRGNFFRVGGGGEGGSQYYRALTGEVFPRPPSLETAKLCPARLNVHLHVLLPRLGAQLHAPPTSRRLADPVRVADNGQGPPQEAWRLRWKLTSVNGKRNVI